MVFQCVAQTYKQKSNVSQLCQSYYLYLYMQALTVVGSHLLVLWKEGLLLEIEGEGLSS